MARRKGWRAVKVHRNYTVDEVAKLLDVAKGTVRRWLDLGLPALKEQKPTLILGRDLADFLKAKKPPKQVCQPDECFCFKCRTPRKAAIGEVEYRPVTASNGQLVALCAVCATVMHKRVSKAALKALVGHLRVTITQPLKRLGEGNKPCLDDN